MDDRELRARVEELTRRYGDMLYRLAYQYTGSPADAEDILQDVCVAMLTKAAPLDDSERMRYWLIRVALNKCHNLCASAHRRRTAPLSEALHLYAPEDEGVLEQIMELPPKYRTVIYLHYYEGYTIDEISRLTREKPNTIGSRLSRGRKRLRLILEDEEDTHETE